MAESLEFVVSFRIKDLESKTSFFSNGPTQLGSFFPAPSKDRGKSRESCRFSSLEHGK